MRPLFRKTVYTQERSLDVRVEQLERRIIPGSVKWAHLVAGGPQTVPDQNTLVLEWEEFATDDPTLFGTIASGSSMPFNNQVGDTTLKVSRVGYAFLAVALVRFEDDPDAYEHGGYIEGGNLDGRTAGSDGTYTVPGYAAFAGNSIDPASQSSFDSMMAISTPFVRTSGAIFTVRAFNGVGLNGGATAPRDVIYASLTVYAWEIGDTEDIDPRVYGGGV